MTTDAGDNDDGSSVDEEFIESMFIRRNARLDPSVWVTDEQYSSGDIFIGSREKMTLPKILDSRLTDRDVENEDNNGSRFNVPVYFYEPEEDVQYNLAVI